MEEPEEKDRNFVTALARGLDVLRAFRPGEPALSNTDLSERTGLPKATVSRLTHTLCRLEYLVSDAQTGSYRLGAGVLQLGFGVLASLDIGERAGALMRGLRDGPNSYITVALGERHRDEVLYLAVQISREDVALSMRVGSRLPLFFSAIGRAVLVGLSEVQREEVFKAAAREDPAGADARAHSFENAAAEYAANGFCTGYGDWRADVNGIAVPVRSLGGRVFGLNVGGPSFHVTPGQLESVYAPQLIAAGQQLSMQP